MNGFDCGSGRTPQMASDDPRTSRDLLEGHRARFCNSDGAPPQLPRSKWRAALRPSVIAMIASAAALAATLASASAQFTSITDFGDSYADTGSAPGGAFRMPGQPYYPNGPYSPTCEFPGRTNFVDSLQAIYHLPTAANYAIGGARTNDTNTISGLHGFTYELAQFNGNHFTNGDLILLSIGGNDMSAIEDPTRVHSRAITSAAAEVAGVQTLVAAGAHNIVIFGTGSSSFFPVPPVGPVTFPTYPNGVPFSDPQRDDWADTCYQQTEQLLALLAHSGVRIFLFDFAVLQARLAVDPEQYGFSGTRCTAAFFQADIPVDPNCFYENSVHPTGAGMAVVAKDMANQIDAPTTVMSQGAIATSLATNFTSSAFGRLEAYRTLEQFDKGATSAIAATAPTKGLRTAAPENRWSVYGGANDSGGGGEQQFLAPGYNDNPVGGDLGLEYRVDPNLRLGAVFGYSAPDVNLNVQNAHDHIDSYQFADCGSFTAANGFADALVGYGRDQYALDRQGVIDVIHGATAADVFTAVAQAGYLIDVGSIRVGPIAGLDYTHAFIHAYTETGDSLLTMVPSRHVLELADASSGDMRLSDHAARSMI